MGYTDALNFYCGFVIIIFVVAVVVISKQHSHKLNDSYCALNPNVHFSTEIVAVK